MKQRISFEIDYDDHHIQFTFCDTTPSNHPKDHSCEFQPSTARNAPSAEAIHTDRPSQE